MNFGLKNNRLLRTGMVFLLALLVAVSFCMPQQTFAAHPKAKVFRDWREMLAALDDQIDAVVVSTPDHMHFQT